EKRYLTLQEAESLIPAIEKRLTRLIQLNKTLVMLNSIEINYEDEFQFIKNEISSRKVTHKLYNEFYTLLEEILNYGAIVKDLDIGLADFYSIHNGKEILLCWRLGEEKIKYWHESDSGYDQRKPIDLLKNA
ncbi:MAG: DUF2203 domain-containing protein, partial [Nanoarchaeota archaeon]